MSYSTELGYKVALALGCVNSRLVARGSQEVEFAQPRDHLSKMIVHQVYKVRSVSVVIVDRLNAFSICDDGPSSLLLSLSPFPVLFEAFLSDRRESAAAMSEYYNPISCRCISISRGREGVEVQRSAKRIVRGCEKFLPALA